MSGVIAALAFLPVTLWMMDDVSIANAKGAEGIDL